MLLVGTFPFNSFLAGILCSLSFFSLTGENLGAQERPLLSLDCCKRAVECDAADAAMLEDSTWGLVEPAHQSALA